MNRLFVRSDAGAISAPYMMGEAATVKAWSRTWELSMTRWNDVYETTAFVRTTSTIKGTMGRIGDMSAADAMSIRWHAALNLPRAGEDHAA
jgi:hypothetical protein